DADAQSEGRDRAASRTPGLEERRAGPCVRRRRDAHLGGLAMSQIVDTRADPVSFALALYRRTVTGDDPALLSPVSIALVLDLLRAGARGETAAGMHRALGGDEPAPEDRPNPDRFLDADGTYLSLAACLWIDRTFALDPDFARLVSQERRLGWC